MEGIHTKKRYSWISQVRLERAELDFFKIFHLNPRKMWYLLA